MSDNDLNLNFDNTPEEKSFAEQSATKSSVFKFDPRALFIWISTKWRLILIAFFVFLAIFWSILKYQSDYSSKAWSASAKVFHQTRSERVPSFYKPVDTSTVMQFISSQDAFARVAGRLNAQFENFDKSLFKSVEIGIDRSRKNIIFINADASNPQMAIALVNAIAEEGISEYIRRQNNSMRTMSEERKLQRESIDKEIDAIQDEKKKYYSERTGLPPDLELTKVRDDISAFISKRDEHLLQQSTLAIRLKNTEVALANTPKNVEFETVVDNAKTIGLDGKKKELETLRKRYTEANPKVLILKSEIADLEKEKASGVQEAPAKITYRKNDIYSDLMAQISNMKLELSMIEESIKQIDIEIARKRKIMTDLQEVNKNYSAVLRRENMLNEKSTKLADKINDIEFLVGSAVPDVSMLEPAKVPFYNMQKMRLKVLVFTIMATLFFIFLMSIFRVAKMKFLSSRDFKLAFGLENLGEIPVESDHSPEVKMSAMQTITRNIQALSTGSKKVAFLKFDAGENLENAIEEMLSIGAVKGVKSFRLRCTPASKADQHRTAEPADEIAAKLISTQKFADTGVFYYQNNYCLDVVEADLLGFDLDILTREYDLVTIEALCDENSGQLSSQLANLSDCIVISATFDKTGKFTIQENIDEMKHLSALKIGGLLTNVPKPYYKR